jgi:hypothetical protein
MPPVLPSSGGASYGGRWLRRRYEHGRAIDDRAKSAQPEDLRIFLLEQLRTTMRLAVRIADQPIPAEMEKDLLQAFRDWKSQP